MESMWGQIVVILFSLFFSAFFSGIEIAFISANRLKLELDRKKGALGARIIELFARHPGQFIATMLVGNNIALVVYGIEMANVLEPLLQIYVTSEAALLTIKTILSTIVILFTAEFLPKALFRLNPNGVLTFFSFPITILYILFYPLAKLSTTISLFILRLFFRVRIHDTKHKKLFDKIELSDLISETSSKKTEESSHEQHDIKIFKNALGFQDLKVRECMIPRTEIEGVDLAADLEEIRSAFIRTNFSRLLVFQESRDNIIGYLNSKDLFHNPESIEKMLKSVDFIPETMPAHKLLTNLIKSHQNLAIVVDEFGGTAGMVTLEDLMEEIFGEIEDEHDSDDLVEKKLSDSQFVFSGRLEVDYLNETYQLKIPETDEYETIAGFLIFQNESIPAQGETINIDRFRVKVLKMSGTRIDLVHLTLLEEP